MPTALAKLANRRFTGETARPKMRSEIGSAGIASAINARDVRCSLGGETILEGFAFFHDDVQMPTLASKQLNVLQRIAVDNK
jgi:hypothetical protein